MCKKSLEILVIEFYKGEAIKRVIIFGLGYYGRAIFRKLQRNPNKYTIVCFIDNDTDKHGGEFANIPILSPKKLKKIDFDKVLIAGRSIQSQIEQLENQLQIPKSKIRVLKKSEVAISGIDSLNREKSTLEMVEIVLKIFTRNRIDYWLDYSSLLALCRKGKLSDYSDVDISLISYNAANILWKELSSLNIPGIEISKGYDKDKSSHKIIKIKMSSVVNIEKEEPALIDIAVKSRENDSYVNDINGIPTYTPVKYLSGFTIKGYHNLELRMPLHVGEYLEFVYGRDWKIPAEYWYEDSYGNLIK